jgi:DNA-directed RNA polymerase subunit RPC12/RpoP
MLPRAFERRYGQPITLDFCQPCQVIWFDDQELLQLTPGATLDLLSSIVEKQGGARPPLAERLVCPRCGRRLVEVMDQQRNTRFSYFRCAVHGRLLTFFQFLRAKNFVRSLGAAEVADLKQRVRQVNCSNCGAPVDIDRGSACAHCRTPIAIIDPDQVRKAVAEMREAEAGRAIDPTWPLRVAAERERAEAAFAAAGSHSHLAGIHGAPDGLDLIAVGLRVLRGLLE